MNMYNVEDLQQFDRVEVMSEQEVRGFAFGLINVRSDIDDDWGNRLSSVVKEGFNNFTFNQAVEFLEIWEFKVEKIAS